MPTPGSLEDVLAIVYWFAPKMLKHWGQAMPKVLNVWDYLYQRFRIGLKLQEIKKGN